MFAHELNADRPVMGGFQVLLNWLRRFLPQRSLDAGDDAELELTFQTPRPVRPAEVTQITCLDGAAWLTIEGRLDDVILAPGQVYFLFPKERGLLAGAPTCRVRVMSAGKKPPLQQ